MVHTQLASSVRSTPYPENDMAQRMGGLGPFFSFFFLFASLPECARWHKFRSDRLGSCICRLIVNLKNQAAPSTPSTQGQPKGVPRTRHRVWHCKACTCACSRLKPTCSFLPKQRHHFWCDAETRRRSRCSVVNCHKFSSSAHGAQAVRLVRSRHKVWNKHHFFMANLSVLDAVGRAL